MKMRMNRARVMALGIGWWLLLIFSTANDFEWVSMFLVVLLGIPATYFIIKRIRSDWNKFN